MTSLSNSNALWRAWNDVEPVKLYHDMTLEGFSIAALRSNFYIKEKRMMFDAGISYNVVPDWIFVTHFHSDHYANLPYHLYGQTNKPIRIFVPLNSIENFQNMIKACMIVSLETFISNEICNNMTILGNEAVEKICNEIDDNKYSSQYPFLICGVTKGQLNIVIKNKKHIIDIFECDHTIDSLGFGITEITNKLKSEYVGMSGKDIGNLKSNGVDIYDIIHHNKFCYLGDTFITVFNKNNDIFKYKYVAIECTFIHDNEIEQANKTKHILWSSLKPYITKYINTTFILYHFSQRYKREEITEFFKGENMSNIIVWNNN